jgi:predicted RNase H-like HicB family nuclease
MREMVFIIHKAEEGGFWAEAVGASISTQGDSLDELYAMISDAVAGYYFDEPEAKPDQLCWRFDEPVLAA